jgi:hypothetical protein
MSVFASCVMSSGSVETFSTLLVISAYGLE